MHSLDHAYFIDDDRFGVSQSLQQWRTPAKDQVVWPLFANATLPVGAKTWTILPILSSRSRIAFSTVDLPEPAEPV
ncbi:hypothetical protein Trco_007841 [Trichoderma cornu-damae]|uniref:Uncharacterized protein n=1 Tax=Trichoderma cornu-damae TaxID=654480 RepID=A0A9P8QJV9_9HYPO|nr:hypothetical protein Trco_007841 [Trichoderma cornu-damae]